MKYSELIQLYKQNKLNDEEKSKVESDIDRHTAISEYLYEMDEIEGLENINQNDKDEFNDVKKNDDVKFMHQIKHSIHMAFIKLGIITGGIVLVLVLFIIFLLPKAVDKMYYDPTKIVGESENGPVTTKLSLDFAVYSELFLPGNYREDTISDSNGYGNYDINILQTLSYNGEFQKIAGRINKGKMILYDANILTPPVRNAFVPDQIGISESHYGVGAMGSREDAIKALDELDSTELYTAYITLNKVMSYDEFKKLCIDNDLAALWCAICNKNEEGYYNNDIIGFINSTSCSDISYDKEKYPYLSQFDSVELQDSDGWLENDIMEIRLDSLLRYMSDNKDFTDILGETNLPDYTDIRESIKNYGINIYGFVVIGKKDEIVRISQLEDIYYVYTTLYY